MKAYAYKIDCVQFNRLVDINTAAKKGDEQAAFYMENRGKRFYSKKSAREFLNCFKRCKFYYDLSIVEVY